METFSLRNLHNPILSAFPIIIWSRHACHSIDILAKRNSCNARCLKYEKYELKSLIKGGLNFKALYSQMEKFGLRIVAKQIVHTHVYHDIEHLVKGSRINYIVIINFVCKASILGFENFFQSVRSLSRPVCNIINENGMLRFP